MTDFISILMIPFVTGAAIGLLFFGGLWWTVRRINAAGRPFRLTISSFFFRMGFSLTALHFITEWQWQRLVPAILGFMMIRLIMVCLIEHS